MWRDTRRFELNGLWLILWGLCVGCSSTEPSVTSAARHGRLAISEGEEDIENRYPEVVRITTSLDGKAKGRCSGVLLDPRLVLTAGHCACKPRPDTTAGGFIIANSACDARKKAS